MNAVLRITDTSQTITVTATANGESETKVYALTNLVLGAAG